MMNKFKKQIKVRFKQIHYMRPANVFYTSAFKSLSKNRIRTMSNGPTIRDVAKQAGVSLGTASNVLNNKGNVSAEVRNRVLAAVHILGYKHPVRLPALS